jgi:hypothetical protein
MPGRQSPGVKRSVQVAYGQAIEELEDRDPELAWIIRDHVALLRREAGTWRRKAQEARRDRG